MIDLVEKYDAQVGLLKKNYQELSQKNPRHIYLTFFGLCDTQELFLKPIFWEIFGYNEKPKRVGLMDSFRRKVETLSRANERLEEAVSEVN